MLQPSHVHWEITQSMSRKGSCIDNGATEGLCAQAHNDSNALDAIMCRVGAGQQAEGHIGNPLST